MDSSRDEARLLADVMAHANLTHRIGWIGDVPVATFRAASPACEEGCDFFVDMPGGWLRVTTSLPLAGEPSHELLVRLARIQLDGGSGQGAFDRGQVRLSVSLPGLQPFGSPVIGAVQRLHELRRAVSAGLPAPRYVSQDPDAPTLEAAALALGRRVPLVWAPDDSYGVLVGDGAGRGYAVRLWSPWRDVVAIEATCVPPWPQADDEPGLRAVARMNSGVVGGELLAIGGVLRWRWSCPRSWIDLDHLAGIVVPTIFGTFRELATGA